MRSDDAMARDHQRDGVGAAGAADRDCGSVQAARELAVGARFAGRDLGDPIPHPTLKRATRRREREVEPELAIVEIALDLPAGALGHGVGRRGRAFGERQIVDSRYGAAAGTDAEHREWRPELGRVSRWACALVRSFTHSLVSLFVSPHASAAAGRSRAAAQNRSTASRRSSDRTSAGCAGRSR